MEYLSAKNSFDKKTGFSSSVGVNTVNVSLKFKSDVIEFSRPKIKAY